MFIHFSKKNTMSSTTINESGECFIMRINLLFVELYFKFNPSNKLDITLKWFNYLIVIISFKQFKNFF